MSLNLVVLLGNLGADPEGVEGKNGTICNFRMATNEKWKDKSGEKQEKVEWHKVVAFGKLGDFVMEYFTKGKAIQVEGKLQTRTWDDKEGNKKYSTEVVAERIKFVP